MTFETDHPLVDFATRYSDPTQDYLNAYIAIARLESLLEDLDRVGKLLDDAEPAEERWAPWFGAEVVSYYAVGMVTCLEWHAKSRLIDLLTFNPKALKVEDVRGTISDKLIVQMVGKQGSVIQLVGAAVRVNSLDKYLSVIGRVFASLGFPCSVSAWLTGNTSEASVCWVNPSQFAMLEYLFGFRHQLVHEVGMETIGHWNVRSSWSPAEAKQYGILVAAVMHGIEAALTRFAPKLFPNRLTEERWPVPIAETLAEELERLQDFADREVRAFDWNERYTADDWVKALQAFRQYHALEERFIERAGMLHWRYFDARTPLRVRLLQYRIGFLNELLSHFSSGYADKADDPPL